VYNYSNFQICARIRMFGNSQFEQSDTVGRRWQDEFYRGNLKPKSASSILQDLSFWFCRLQLSKSSELVISKKLKSRIAVLVHSIGSSFQMGRAVKGTREYTSPNAPDPVWKNPGGNFWTKRNTNKSWNLWTHRQVKCNRKIGKIELAE